MTDDLDDVDDYVAAELAWLRQTKIDVAIGILEGRGDRQLAQNLKDTQSIEHADSVLAFYRRH